MSFQPPPIRSSFIGRDHELAALGQLLRRPGIRLVTVVGSAGVGKTRLVTELTGRLAHDFPGGVRFVSLAHVHQADLVLGEVAAELGIRDLDASGTLDRIVDRLGRMPVLLVLDNLEQVPGCAPALSQLLQRCPQLTLIATSRQPMLLHGEVEFPVRPLPVGAEDDSESPAEQLFLLRAREASYGFVATPENRAAIREIGQRLDGLPLAIELAASWVKVLPPQRLLENLDRQLDVLVRGPRDLPERQQTMRSAIAWSYQLLSDLEQRLFCRLSVFAGPFTLSDVEEVAGDAQTLPAIGQSDLMVLEGLSSLVTKNLVQVVDDPVDPAEPEYGMLEIIRAFAFERSVEHGSTVELRDYHLAYFTCLAERWNEELPGPNRELRLAQIDREYPNFRKALAWAAETNDTPRGMRLIVALWRYWDWGGFHAEGARWCDRFLDAVEDTDPQLRANALYAGAAIAFMQSNYARSMTLADLCLVAAEESGDDLAIARGLLAAGNATYDQGNLERASEIYRRSLELARQSGEPVALQVALVNLGFVHYQVGSLEAARQLFEEACALGDRNGPGSTTDWATVGLAQVEYRLGDAATAERRLASVIDRQRVADTGQLGAALLALAAIVRRQGRFDESVTLGRASLANRQSREERAFLTDSLAEIASLAIAAGALEAGVTLATAVASQRNRIGYGLPDREWVALQAAVESSRVTLGEAGFAGARAHGERMTVPEAIDFANQLRLEAPGSTRSPEPAPVESQVLTKREQEVLQLIVAGKTDREIARELSISTGTASRHVANILHKLDARSRSAAAAWAIRNGIA